MCSKRREIPAKAALVGFGNDLHGDDAIGLIVARHIYDYLEDREAIDLLELSSSDFVVMERLIGYGRAVIVDALVTEEAEVGRVTRVDLPESSGYCCGSPHAGGLSAALGLARKLGLAVPSPIAVYGIGIRQPPSFADSLSEELAARIPEIVESITRAEAGWLR